MFKSIISGIALTVLIGTSQTVAAISPEIIQQLSNLPVGIWQKFDNEYFEKAAIGNKTHVLVATCKPNDVFGGAIMEFTLYAKQPDGFKFLRDFSKTLIYIPQSGFPTLTIRPKKEAAYPIGGVITYLNTYPMRGLLRELKQGRQMTLRNIKDMKNHVFSLTNSANALANCHVPR